MQGSLADGAGRLSMSRLVERIFKRMAEIYGARFADMWDGVTDFDSVKAEWGDALTGYTVEEIKLGVESCRRRAWPPTLPEFLAMCRPPPDYERLYRQAADAIHTRRWPSRLCYWAAQSFGVVDLRVMTYKVAAARWRRCVDEMAAESSLPDIPQQRDALPPPGRIHNREAARAALAKCREILGCGEA